MSQVDELRRENEELRRALIISEQARQQAEEGRRQAEEDLQQERARVRHLQAAVDLLATQHGYDSRRRSYLCCAVQARMYGH